MPTEENKRMTFAEALELLKEAYRKGVYQGTDLAKSREAQRIVIAHRIRTERIEKGITQAEIAEAINSNELTYKGYENCKSDIPIVYLVRIADYYDLSLDYLTGRTDDVKPKDELSLEERVRILEEIILPRE